MLLSIFTTNLPDWLEAILCICTMAGCIIGSICVINYVEKNKHNNNGPTLQSR